MSPNVPHRFVSSAPPVAALALAVCVVLCVVLGAVGCVGGCVVDNGKQATPPTTTPTAPATQPTPTPTTPTADCPDESSPLVSYTSKDPSVCAAALFQCPDGHTLFTNECGCGCVAPATTSACPDENVAGVSYKSKDASMCARIRYTCPAGHTAFSDASCGCGCAPSASKTPTTPPERQPTGGDKTPTMPPDRQTGGNKTPTMPPERKPKANCPEAAIAGVDYKSRDTSFCARARIACGAGTKPFSSDCGCGCVPIK